MREKGQRHRSVTAVAQAEQRSSWRSALAPDAREPPAGMDTAERRRLLELDRSSSRPTTRPILAQRVAMPKEDEDFRPTPRDAYYRRALALSDLLAAVIAVPVAVEVFGDDSLKLVFLLAVPIVVLVSKLVSLYDRDELLLNKTTLDEAPALFYAATFFTLLIWLFEERLVVGQLGDAQVIGLWGVLFVSMTAGRTWARQAVKRFAPSERCVLVGDASAAEWLTRKLQQTRAIESEVVGRVPLEPEAGTGQEDIPVVGSLPTLGLVLARLEVDRVVIIPGPADQDMLLDTIRLVKTLGVKVSVLPRLFEVVGSSVEFDNVDGVTLLGVRRFGMTRSSRLLKRGMDVTLSGASLILCAPVMLVAAAFIKLGSPGPVLFRQRRIGRNGHEFFILKFRTMVAEAETMKSDLRHLNEAQGVFKMADDPRITRFGRFLRRSCLDELPQLLNVVRGEMSLVGPRPLIPDEDRQIEGWNRRRLNLTPGITGFWQVSGSARIPLQEMVTIDYLYGANWSLWGDVKIMLRTVPYMLARRGL